MRVEIPDVCLVVLVGPSCAGKSWFAQRSFAPSSVISADHCRRLVADDENDWGATGPALEVLHLVVARRLAAGRRTVVDATNLDAGSRSPLLALAHQHNLPAVAVVFDLPAALLEERNRVRPDRRLSPRDLRRQVRELKRARRQLEPEGFQQVITLDTVEDVEVASVLPTRRPTDRRDEQGPFDIIGDVHGCVDELVALLGRLGYQVEDGLTGASHPGGRKAVLVGDLVDRGPDTPGVLRLVMGMARAGTALCVPGNHENKLLRALQGRDVQVGHGLARSLAQLAECSPAFRAQVVSFLDGLAGHLVLDGGRLVVAHAGLPEPLHNNDSARARNLAMYGETTGETDDRGHPVRYPWAEDYRGTAMVVYGHTPVHEPRWVNNTICIDTGCVFGGALTALRYPERELVHQPAAQPYFAPSRSA